MLEILMNFAIVATVPVGAYLALGRLYLRGSR